LRYFYEDFPQLFIIAAGSLLETLLSDKISFPVGRVEFLPVRPCNFVDFLSAMKENQSIELLKEPIVPDFAHERLMSLFNIYTLIGGMPEAISNYSKNKDIIEVNKILSNLLTTYIDDSEKYASSSNTAQYLRHILKTGFAFSGQRIKFERFGESNYKSREMGEAFRTLEKAFLLELVYPTACYKSPAIADLKKSPRLQWLDTGLTNYFAGVQNEVFFTKNIDEIWKGKVAELITGQELIAYDNDILNKRIFWVRQSKNSNAEIDYILNIDGLLIPIEVKHTAGSHLRSLLIFLDNAPHNLGVRIWSKKFEINELTTENNKKIKLINIPFYQIMNIKKIVRKYL